MTRRASVFAMAAAAGAGFAAWISLGAVAPAGDTAAARIGVLPPAWMALLLVVAAVGAAWLASLKDDEAWPLLVPLVLVLPWLPGPVPAALLVWTGGGVESIFWATTGLGLAVALRGRWRSATRPWSIRAHLAAAGLLAALAFGAAAWRMAPILPGGDEPHYLVLTQSLLHDGDLRIENNHTRREYLAYVQGDLRPDFLRRGRDGQIYSIHAPGVSALVLPAFALGGYPAAVLFLAIFAAAGSLFVWHAAWLLTTDRGAAWVGWAAVALTAPFFFQAFTVYPDGPAAAIVAVATWALVRGPERMGLAALAGTGAALAALPWLHTRAAVLAFVLGLLMLGRLATDVAEWPARLRRAACLLVVPAMSAAAWFWSFHAIYGTWDPRAPYGGYTQTALGNIGRGTVGLLVDQQFGLIPNAPVYALAALGLFTLLRHRRRLAIEIASIVLPYLLAVAAYYMWWGGRSSPARFLVPALLPLGLPVAVWWAKHTGTRSRTIAGALAAASLILTGALAWIDHGALVYDARDGYALWVDALSDAVSLPRVLPSLFQGSARRALAVAVLWGALFALAAAVGWRLATVGRPSGREAAPGRAAACLALSLAAAVTLGVAMAGAGRRSGEILEPGSAQLAVARAAASGRPLVVRWPTGSGSGAFDLPIATASRRPADPTSPLWTGRDVPPGEYRLDAVSGRNVTGRLAASSGGRLTLPLESWDLEAVPPGRLPARLYLPFGLGSLSIAGDAAARERIEGLRLVPVRFLAPDAPRARLGVRLGPALVFALDARSDVEPGGIWTHGGTTAELGVIVWPPGAGARLIARNGPLPNVVRVRGAGSSIERALGPGEAIELDVRSGEEERLAIESSGGFRPADVEPGSRDVRYLGVRVEVSAR